MENTTNTTNATEYDVAQALGHPLPAPRNSTVWVASLVGEAGGFLQGVGASKEDALNNLLESLLEEWDAAWDSPWEDRAYEVYADHAISMGEMDSYARNLVYEEEKSLYIGSRSREEIFQDFLKDEPFKMLVALGYSLLVVSFCPVSGCRDSAWLKLSRPALAVEMVLMLIVLVSVELWVWPGLLRQHYPVLSPVGPNCSSVQYRVRSSVAEPDIRTLASRSLQPPNGGP